jgi:hypothetical protein
MNLKFLAIPLLSLSVVLISCGENSEDKKNQEAGEDVSIDSTINVNESVSSDNNEVTYTLPSALQIAYVLKKSGAEFIPSLLNDRENITKYNVSNYKKAVNFGIYSTDLSYCLFNKKYQESKEYIKTCKDIGSALGLNQAFESDNMAQRFDKNITNEDSVIKIVSNIQLKTDLMFEQNKQKHVPVIAFAGAWIESVYIGSEAYAKGKNKKVLASFMEQLLLSETIIKALKKYQTTEKEIPALISSIENIHTKFYAIASVKTEVEKDEEMDFNSMPVTVDEMKTITELIKTLRASIIN